MSFRTSLISTGVRFSKNCLVGGGGRNLGQVREATCKFEEATRDLTKFKSHSKLFMAWGMGVINHPGLGCRLRRRADSGTVTCPSSEWGHGDPASREMGQFSCSQIYKSRSALPNCDSAWPSSEWVQVEYNFYIWFLPIDEYIIPARIGIKGPASQWALLPALLSPAQVGSDSPWVWE